MATAAPPLTISSSFKTTAIVKFPLPTGGFKYLAVTRTLLDTGGEANFITQALVTALQSHAPDIHIEGDYKIFNATSTQPFEVTRRLDLKISLGGVPKTLSFYVRPGMSSPNMLIGMPGLKTFGVMMDISKALYTVSTPPDYRGRVTRHVLKPDLLSGPSQIVVPSSTDGLDRFSEEGETPEEFEKRLEFAQVAEGVV